MKKIIPLGLILSLIIGSCTQEKKSPIEGAWQFLSMKGMIGDSVTGEMPNPESSLNQIKIWSGNHFVFVGENIVKGDTIISRTMVLHDK